MQWLWAGNFHCMFLIRRATRHLCNLSFLHTISQQTLSQSLLHIYPPTIAPTTQPTSVMAHGQNDDALDLVDMQDMSVSGTESDDDPLASLLNDDSDESDGSEFFEEDPRVPDLAAEFPITRDPILLTESASYEESTLEDQYPLDFDSVIGRDPVLGIILDQVSKNTEAKYRHYEKHFIALCFYKLACIRELKASNLADAELSIAFRSVSLSGTGQALNKEDDAARSARRQLIDLTSQSKHVDSRANELLGRLIHDSGRILNRCYDSTYSDDLCLVLYAITSDAYYPVYETRLLESNDSFHVHVITHLRLISGKPAQCESVSYEYGTAFHEFLASIPGALKTSKERQPARLAFQIERSNHSGSWLYQAAGDITKLSTERRYWQDLDAVSYNQMKRIRGENIFLIHVRVRSSLPGLLLTVVRRFHSKSYP